MTISKDKNTPSHELSLRWYQGSREFEPQSAARLESLVVLSQGGRLNAKAPSEDANTIIYVA
jgi:hypothetical protein